MPKKIALLDTEEGSGSVANLVEAGTVEVFRARSYEETEKAIAAVAKNVAEFERIVLDTTTTLCTTVNQDLSLKGGSRQNLWGRKDSLGISQQQWGQMSSMMIFLTRNMYELPIQTVLICHEGSRENPYDGIDMHAPDLNKMLLKDLYGMNDAVVRLGKLPAKANIGGKDYPAGTRILRLQDSAQYMAKGRDALPYARPELLAEPTMSSFLEVCKPAPRKIVLYGPPGVGKTVLACSA